MTTTEDAKITPLVWLDPATLTVEGKGWNDTANFYDRFPTRAKEIVDENLWALSRNSAGILIKFATDSPEIHARWKLVNERLALPHMPATGVSGLDLYVRHRGKLRYLATGCYPYETINEYKLIGDLSGEMREYSLHLPLYNGLESIEIGVVEGYSIQGVSPKNPQIKPVVFYGSSIVQGGCSSRPGTAYPTIIGRKLEIRTINLGFSGSGRCEKEVVDLLIELDPSIFVIDCIPNMKIDYVDERIRYLLDRLKSTHPKTPVILIEQPMPQSEFISSDKQFNMRLKNEALRKIFDEVESSWGGGLHYIEWQFLLGDDGEPTVDGIHPTDLGFFRMADAIAPVIERVLKQEIK